MRALPRSKDWNHNRSRQEKDLVLICLSAPTKKSNAYAATFAHTTGCLQLWAIRYTWWMVASYSSYDCLIHYTKRYQSELRCEGGPWRNIMLLGGPLSGKDEYMGKREKC